MNIFTFSGNLGKNAEVKVIPNGSTVCEFSVAVKSGYGQNAKTNWVRCAMFGKRAEGGLPQHLTKGAQVVACGELELQEWEGQNGKGAALSVRVSELTLVGGNKQDNQQQEPANGGYQPPQPPQQQAQSGYQQPQQPQQQGQNFYQQPQQPQQGGYQPPQGGYKNA